MVDIQSATAENRPGKKKKEKTTAAKYDGLGGHNYTSAHWGRGAKSRVTPSL